MVIEYVFFLRYYCCCCCRCMCFESKNFNFPGFFLQTHTHTHTHPYLIIKNSKKTKRKEFIFFSFSIFFSRIHLDFFPFVELFLLFFFARPDKDGHFIFHRQSCVVVVGWKTKFIKSSTGFLISTNEWNEPQWTFFVLFCFASCSSFFYIRISQFGKKDEKLKTEIFFSWFHFLNFKLETLFRVWEKSRIETFFSFQIWKKNSNKNIIIIIAIYHDQRDECECEWMNSVMEKMWKKLMLSSSS